MKRKTHVVHFVEMCKLLRYMLLQLDIIIYLQRIWLIQNTHIFILPLSVFWFYKLPTSSEYGKTQVILVPDAAAFRSNNRYNSSMTFREHDCCQTIIHGLKAYSHYEIRVAASNVAGDGPLSMPFTVKTAEAG